MSDEIGNLDQNVENNPIDRPVETSTNTTKEPAATIPSNEPQERRIINGIEFAANGFATNLKAHMVTFTPRDDIQTDEEAIQAAVRRVLDEENAKIKELEQKAIEESKNKKKDPDPLPEDTTGPATDL
jgi:hypothetical protein